MVSCVIQMTSQETGKEHAHTLYVTMLSIRGMMYDWPDPEAEKGTRSYDPMAS